MGGVWWQHKGGSIKEHFLHSGDWTSQFFWSSVSRSLFRIPKSKDFWGKDAPQVISYRGNGQLFRLGRGGRRAVKGEGRRCVVAHGPTCGWRLLGSPLPSSRRTPPKPPSRSPPGAPRPPGLDFPDLSSANIVAHHHGNGGGRAYARLSATLAGKGEVNGRVGLLNVVVVGSC